MNFLNCISYQNKFIEFIEKAHTTNIPAEKDLYYRQAFFYKGLMESSCKIVDEDLKNLSKKW
jgi:hypothetical protein